MRIIPYVALLGLITSVLAYGGPKYATGFRHIPGISGRLFTYEDTGKLDIPVPNDFSWKDTGKLAPIANQGGCGSCWSFALTYSLIDNLTLFGEPAKGILSPQYLVSCARTMYGCNGGTFAGADYLMDLAGGGKGIGGAPLLSQMPYTARNGSCPSNLTNSGSLVEWHYVGSSNKTPSTLDIQKAMVTYGVIPIVLAADNAFMNTKDTIFNGRARGINHMIIAVGFHNEGATANASGEYPSGKGYWEVRNSWGPGWGVGGFGKIRYHANSIGAEAAFMKMKEAPVPPVPREFAMESKNLMLKVVLSEKNSMKVEDAKNILQPFLNTMDAR